MDDLDAIKGNLGVIRVYSQFVKGLRKVGDKYVGLCPIHGEKTPSFTIFPDMRYNCFGCQAAGNIFQLLEKVDNCDFKTAVEKVKKELGGWFEAKDMVESTFAPVAEPKVYERLPLSGWQKYEDALINSKIGLRWLSSERGIELETAQRLHLGFAQSIGSWSGPDGSDIVSKGWIGFPSVENEEVVSIKFRSIVRKKPGGFARRPKMATALFNAETISPFDSVYLVEGEIDALTLEQSGFHAVSVPSAGTKLTPEMKDTLMQAECVILAGDTDPTGSAYLEKLLKELGERTYLLKWPEPFKDANEFFLKGCDRDVSIFRTKVEELTAKAKSNLPPDIYSIQDVMKNGEDKSLSEREDRLRFPWTEVDKGAILLPGSLLGVLATNTGMGKALANGTNILTPSGLVKIEDICVGDKVIGSSGKPVVVTGVFPQGIKEGYRVTFTDKTSVVCCEDHLWSVQSPFMKSAGHGFRTLSVKQILAMAELGKGFKAGGGKGRGFRHHLPRIGAVGFEKNSVLPVDPYLLGALLGDGGFTGTTPTFTNTDSQMIEEVRKLLPEDIEMRRGSESRIQYTLCAKKGKREPGNTNGLKNALKSLGVWGLYSHEKFVPNSYKLSSVEDRISLVQGLMDADGGAFGRGHIHFWSTSEKLMDDFLWIIRSLGGNGTKSKQTRKGERTGYYTNVYLPEGTIPFRLTRKINRITKRRCEVNKSILSIEKTQPSPMTCISVNAEDGLFVLDDFIVTHNTSFVLQYSLYGARKHNEVVINWQCELTPSEISVMVAAQVLRKNRNFLTKEDLKQAAEELGDVKYYVGNNPSVTNIDEVFDIIEAAVRRTGATQWILDNAMYYTTGIDDEVRVQAAAMRRGKQICVTYGCKGTIVFQPRKASSQSKGKKTHITDIRGSAGAGDTSDAVVAIHRDLSKEDEKNDIYEERTLVEWLKTRSKGTGKSSSFLHFFGEFCCFESLTSQEEPAQEMI